MSFNNWIYTGCTWNGYKTCRRCNDKIGWCFYAFDQRSHRWDTLTTSILLIIIKFLVETAQLQVFLTWLKILEEGHSRIPIYTDDNREHVHGVLLTKRVNNITVPSVELIHFWNQHFSLSRSILKFRAVWRISLKILGIIIRLITLMQKCLCINCWIFFKKENQVELFIILTFVNFC